MSRRIGRHGQQKGNSDARLAREAGLNQRPFKRRGKTVRTQPRLVSYSPVVDGGGRYPGVVLRRLRSLWGVGPVRALHAAKTAKPEWRFF